MREEKSYGSDKNMPNPNKVTSDDLSKQILSSLKSFAGEDTQRWILNLDDLEVKQEAESIALTDKIQNMTAVTLIDKMFDDFQRYAFEFNKNSPAEPFIQCERPITAKASSTSTSKYNYDENPMLFQGHLVTRSWAMITQAYQEKISVYVVPTEHYFGFNPRSFNSFVDIEANHESGETYWLIKGEPLTLQMLSTLTKKLFAFIVKVEKGESNPSERFTLKPVREEQSTKLPPKPDQSDALALMTPDMNSAASTPVQSHPPASKEDKGHHSNKSAPGKNPLDQNLNAVRTVCHDFMQIMDDELNKITQLGVQSMQSQDLVVVQKVMRRTATLKSFKERMKAMLEEWKSVSQS